MKIVKTRGAKNLMKMISRAVEMLERTLVLDRQVKVKQGTQIREKAQGAPTCIAM